MDLGSYLGTIFSFQAGRVCSRLDMVVITIERFNLAKVTLNWNIFEFPTTIVGL